MEYKSIVSDEVRASLERFTSNPEAMAEAERKLKQHYRSEKRKAIIEALLSIGFAIEMIAITYIILLMQ